MTPTDNSGPPDATVPVLLVRLRPAVGVGERQRTVHMVPIPETDGVMPDVLAAWCGFKIKPGEAETLERFAGMPCEKCLAHAPTPEGRRLRRAMPSRIR